MDITNNEPEVAQLRLEEFSHGVTEAVVVQMVLRDGDVTGMPIARHSALLPAKA